MRQFNVTEKGMPPLKIISLGRQVGFRDFRVYPHAFRIQREAFRRPAVFKPSINKMLQAWRLGARIVMGPWRLLYQSARLTAWSGVACWASGITVLVK
jgi:hypothetical protein